MERKQFIQTLNGMLLAEMPQFQEFADQFSQDTQSQRRLLRSLMNVREPAPLDDAFVSMQDALLSAEREEKGVVSIATLPRTGHPQLLLWQGDITRLGADAIVNAANSELLGCFYPCHACIDNAIHSAAGLQLRQECNRLIKLQGHPEPAGGAKITPAYNLPSKFVLHTVGPVISGPLRQVDCDLLASCYRSCLSLACRHGLSSVAFCCISTGEFHFPPGRAAEIAIHTVKEFLAGEQKEIQVIFNVFKESDLSIYKALLGSGAG